MSKEDQEIYVQAVLRIYRQLPDTPERPRLADRKLAHELYRRGVALEIIEIALRLAIARRRARPNDAIPLTPIRSLHYFLPVIDELPNGEPPDGYLEHLRRQVPDKARSTNTLTRLDLPLQPGGCPEKDVLP